MVWTSQGDAHGLVYNSEEDEMNNFLIIFLFSCLCVSVMDLEEKLHRSEMDRRNSLQQAQLLGGQLQEVRGELADTLDHLQELRDLLQQTQLTSDQQQAAIDKLAAELRWAAPPPCSDCWEATAVHPSLDIQNFWGQFLRSFWVTSLLMFGWGQPKLSTLCCCLFTSERDYDGSVKASKHILCF